MRFGLPLFVGAACVFLIVPIAIVVVLAFSGGTFLKFPPDTYSLRWFAAFFGDPRWRAALLSSVEIGLVACVLATSIGFLGAYALVRGRFPLKRLILSAALLPIIAPTIVTSIAMYYAASSLGLVGSRLWVGVCHAVIALPVVLLILLSTLQSVDVQLERAALSLGCGRARMMRTVVVPLALPGIVSAALFAFLTSFDELDHLPVPDQCGQPDPARPHLEQPRAADRTHHRRRERLSDRRHRRGSPGRRPVPPRRAGNPVSRKGAS